MESRHGAVAATHVALGRDATLLSYGRFTDRQVQRLYSVLPATRIRYLRRSASSGVLDFNRSLGRPRPPRVRRRLRHPRPHLRLLGRGQVPEDAARSGVGATVFGTGGLAAATASVAPARTTSVPAAVTTATAPTRTMLAAAAAASARTAIGRDRPDGVQHSLPGGSVEPDDPGRAPVVWLPLAEAAGLHLCPAVGLVVERQPIPPVARCCWRR
ncbi:hypothetical protein ACIF6L_38495 [Kitasatospora sp. NPDC086009]|uniref:hypothetical protein n=1 Tax=unclassified Kitasatospora TaxID=2633591 RepID=UPI0037C8D157